jgi:DNA adenine methylase
MAGFFRYPGGKSKLKLWILDRLSQQAQDKNLEYREPFFGGGSIGLELLQEPYDIKSLWVNDKDPGIACLWTSVIRYPEELKTCVRSFQPSVDYFHLFKQELLSIDKVDDNRGDIVKTGFMKLAIHQTSYSGLGTKSGSPLGGKEQKSKYKIDCRWSPDYICKKIDRIHSKLSVFEIRHDSCTSSDFQDLIEDDSRRSLLYLDPPYYIKGNELYQKGFTERDHERLAESLKKTSHKWVLSYDDCPEIRNMYAGWAVIEQIQANYSINSSRSKPELLIFRRENNV